MSPKTCSDRTQTPVFAWLDVENLPKNLFSLNQNIKHDLSWRWKTFEHEVLSALSMVEFRLSKQNLMMIWKDRGSDPSISLPLSIVSCTLVRFDQFKLTFDFHGYVGEMNYWSRPHHSPHVLAVLHSYINRLCSEKWIAKNSRSLSLNVDGALIFSETHPVLFWKTCSGNICSCLWLFVND